MLYKLNKIKIVKNSFIYFLLNNFYLINIHIYLLAMFFSNVRPGIIMSVMYLAILIGLIRKRRFIHINSLDFIILLYIFFSTISYTWCQISGFTFSNFIEELTSSIFPIFIFYGTKYLNNKKNRFLNVSLNSILFCMALGILLYILMPAFYREYLYRYGFSYSSLVVHCRQGLSSYIGRIASGTLTVFGSFLAAKFYLNTNDKKYLCSFVFLCVCCLLTAQRSAWVGICISILYLVINILLNKKRIDLLFYVLFIGVIIGIFIINLNLFSGNQISEKSLNLADMFSVREFTWLPAIRNVNNLLIGSGLGTVGHRALGINQYYVTDGYFIKLLCEVGIIGITLFVIICISSIYTGFKNWKKNDISILMIIFILLQCIGSNILSTQIIAPIFWICIGICNNKN